MAGEGRRCSENNLQAVGEPQHDVGLRRQQRVMMNLAVDNDLQQHGGCRRASMSVTVFDDSGRLGDDKPRCRRSTRMIERRMTVMTADDDHD